MEVQIRVAAPELVWPGHSRDWFFFLARSRHSPRDDLLSSPRPPSCLLVVVSVLPDLYGWGGMLSCVLHVSSSCPPLRWLGCCLGHGMLSLMCTELSFIVAADLRAEPWELFLACLCTTIEGSTACC